MTPQVYKAFVNGGFHDVMLVKDVSENASVTAYVRLRERYEAKVGYSAGQQAHITVLSEQVRQLQNELKSARSEMVFVRVTEQAQEIKRLENELRVSQSRNLELRTVISGARDYINSYAAY